MDAEALGQGRGPAKYKFIVKTIKNDTYSVGVKTQQGLMIK
jgi:hypothetical protein